MRQGSHFVDWQVVGIPLSNFLLVLVSDGDCDVGTFDGDDGTGRSADVARSDAANFANRHGFSACKCFGNSDQRKNPGKIGTEGIPQLVEFSKKKWRLRFFLRIHTARTLSPTDKLLTMNQLDK
jgi:hypothetical protein